MKFNFFQFSLTITFCFLIALGLHFSIAKAAIADFSLFWFEIAFFAGAFLFSRIVRKVSSKQTAIIRSIFFEYAFSFIYLIFSLLNISVYAHLNFVIIFVLIFLWHSHVLKGSNILVFLLLASFNAVVRWGTPFYLLLVTPSAYLFSLLAGLTLSNGLNSALRFLCPEGYNGMDKNERQNHLKWWSFIFDIKLFVDENYDLNLDKVETRKVMKSEHKSLSDTAFLQIQSPTVLSESLTKIKRRDGRFSYDMFLKRADALFKKIHNAFYSFKIEEIEHLVSDALFERFRYQIDELNKEKTKLISLELIINELQIAQVNLDNNFDVLHLFVRAVSKDYETVSGEENIDVEDIRADKSKILKENVFCEYWSFIRKPSGKTLDCPGLLEGQCPNCGTPIMIGQATVCQNCSSFIRSGQYDWVLAKTTQASAWVYAEPASIPGWKEMVLADPNFSIQQLEDRSSVVFWLLRKAEKNKNTHVLKRFATNEFCENLDYEMKNDSFGRYSSVESVNFESTCLIGISLGKIFDLCYVLVLWTASFFDKNGIIKNRPMRDVVVFSRPGKSSTRLNNAISSIHCANCGGPLLSSYEPACSFCGSQVNDGSEWILTRIIKERDTEFLNLVAKSKEIEPKTRTNKDSVYNHITGEMVSAKDLITITAQILMADGKIDEKEMAMLKTIAAKYSISDEVLQGTLAAVKDGLVYVPVPESKSLGALKLIREACKMALADEELAADETDAIMNLGMQLGYSKLDVQQVINSELSALKRRKEQSNLSLY